MKLKVYIWVDPYPVSWGTSMVFAVAKNLEDAKAKAAYPQNLWAFSQFNNAKAPTTIELGDPTRVLETPCAEWHEWSE